MITLEQRMHLEAYMLALQRYRSQEFGQNEPLSSLAKQWPWLWGDCCPLSALMKALKREITVEEYFNFRVMLCRFTPEVMPFVNERLKSQGYDELTYEMPTLADIMKENHGL